MGKVWDDLTGKSAAEAAAKASTGAAQTSAEAQLEAARIAAEQQQKALDFYKKSTAPMRKAQREGLEAYQSAITNPLSTQEMLEAAQGGDLYRTLLSGQEEAALRANAATGGLRGGGSIADVGSVQNQALMQAFNQEQIREAQNIANLGSLAGLNTGASNIANMMSQLGQTQAQGALGAGTALSQGQVASGQAYANAPGIGGALGSLGGLAGGIGGLVGAFSDRRLKKNIKKIGEENGFTKYSWEWNDIGEKLGLKGKAFGVLSDEVKQKAPEAVSNEFGFDKVNYSMLGVTHG